MKRRFLQATRGPPRAASPSATSPALTGPRFPCVRIQKRLPGALVESLGKTLFLAPSFYQDRLGTNTRNTQQRRAFFIICRIQGGTPTGDGGNSIWTSAGAALQLSASNKFHPGRMLFTGHVNGCQQWWYTDDGETYTFAKNETGHPLCEEPRASISPVLSFKQ